MIAVDADAFEEVLADARPSSAATFAKEFWSERDAGATFREIGAKHGVSHERVRQVLESRSMSPAELSSLKEALGDADIDASLIPDGASVIEARKALEVSGIDQDVVRSVFQGAGLSKSRNWSAVVRKQRLGAEVADWLDGHGPLPAGDVCEHFSITPQMLAELVDSYGVKRASIMAGEGKTGSGFADEDMTGAISRAWKHLRAEVPGVSGLSVSSYDRVRGPKDPSPALITGRLAWRDACEQAGVPCGAGRPDYKAKWTDDDLLGWIRKYAGEAPGRITFDGFDRWRRDQDGAPSGTLLRIRLRRAGHPTWASMVAAAMRPA